jgi:hypothetical protein
MDYVGRPLLACVFLALLLLQWRFLLRRDAPHDATTIGVAAYREEHKLTLGKLRLANYFLVCAPVGVRL